MSVIALLTDFGNRDYYVSAMKGVIKSINQQAEIVDISHEVQPFSVIHGAFILWQACRWFPKGTIFLGVVDPGVGTERKAIVIKASDHLFVGPDNGLLIPAAESLSPRIEVFEIASRWYIPERSGTFDGRDIFAPVAAYLSKGLDPRKIGPPLRKYIHLDLWKVFITEEGTIKGRVLNVDRFGNVVTNIKPEFLDPTGRYLLETRKGLFDVGFVKTFEEAESGGPFLIVGSSNLIEVSARRASASEITGLELSDVVSLNRMQ